MVRAAAKLLSLGCLLLACAACVPGPPLDATAALNNDQDTYFVIGAQPDHVMVVITRGEMVDGKFSLDGWAKPAYAAYPEDGYMVGKAHGGETLAITALFYHATRGSFLTSQYVACGEARALTFTAKPGTVVYLTDVDINLDQRGLYPTYHDHYEAAQAFVKAHYPLLAGKLEHGHYDLVLADRSCS